MLNIHVWKLALAILLFNRHPDPRRVYRLAELSRIAASIARTDASDEEARTLAKVAIHESGAREDATGPLGEKGPFQIMPPGKPTAEVALARVRWSMEACSDLSLYAGCRRCGACPALVAALTAYPDGPEPRSPAQEGVARNP